MEADSILPATTSTERTAPPAGESAPPRASEGPIVAPYNPSPFADPNYGNQAEGQPHLIHSNPTWKLEETQSQWTGLAAAGFIILSLLAMATQTSEPHLSQTFLRGLPVFLQNTLPGFVAKVWAYRHIFAIVGVFFVMFVIETLYFKTQRRHFDFFSPRPVDAGGWQRIGERWLGVFACLGLAGFLYTVLGEYHFWRWPYPDGYYYKRFHTFFVFLVPALLTLCVPYFYLVEKYARHNGPADEFLIFARCLGRSLRGLCLRRYRADAVAALKNAHVHNFLRGMAVKFFFIPLMLTWSVNQYGVAEQHLRAFVYERGATVWMDPHHVALMLRQLMQTGMMMLFVLDLVPALCGYIASMRLLDTHVTSAEPTLFGWMMALACYPPFNTRITGSYLVGADHEHWRVVTVDDPVYSTLAALAIFVLMAIYTWATLAFGIRFSNLTNRGILCNGPYKYVRHPAYICKTACWWIETLPFIATSLPALVIYTFTQIMTTVLYGLRAWTEERHLMREPHYQEYCRKVPYRFIPGVF